MNYGLPYKGSKSAICDWLLQYMPDCDTFVDVFCGGCAVTHAMMCNNKANNYVLNDIKQGIAELFIDGIFGNYKPDYHFVTREEFFVKKDSDAFISNFWSFGNDNKSYLYSKNIEKYRFACHSIIIENNYKCFNELCPEICKSVFEYMKDISNLDFKSRRLYLGKAIFYSLKNCKVKKNPLYSQYIPYLDGKVGLHISPCYHLERIEKILDLKNSDILNYEYKISHKDYLKLDISKDSVVYCDPPYKDKTGYSVQFDYTTFYDWCVEIKRKFNCKIFISEYNIDDPRFYIIAEKQKKVNYCATQTTVKTEKLYGIKQ